MNGRYLVLLALVLLPQVLLAHPEVTLGQGMSGPQIEIFKFMKSHPQFLKYPEDASRTSSSPKEDAIYAAQLECGEVGSGCACTVRTAYGFNKTGTSSFQVPQRLAAIITSQFSEQISHFYQTTEARCDAFGTLQCRRAANNNFTDCSVE